MNQEIPAVTLSHRLKASLIFFHNQACPDKMKEKKLNRFWLIS
jgi:hypothetical protein